MVALGLDAAFLWMLLVTGLAQGWDKRLADWTPWGWRVAVYVAGLAVPWTLVTLPLDWGRGYWVEHRFGRSRESVGHWMWRWLKAQLVGGSLLLLAAVTLTAILWASPRDWWWWMGLAQAGWTVVLTTWMPVVLLPLFYRQRPLANETLGLRLKALAQACGTQVSGVYEIDVSRETVKANAGLCGLGSTRRIVLTDTMMQGLAPEEIETVLAHELGHHRLGHLAWWLVLGAAMAWASFWLTAQILPGFLAHLGIASVQTLAALPALAFVWGIIQVALIPIHHGIGRHFERAADRFALEVTRSPKDFIAALARLQRQNLAESAPSRWVEWLWYDHPPIAQRVAMARAVQTERLRDGETERRRD